MRTEVVPSRLVVGVAAVLVLAFVTAVITAAAANSPPGRGGRRAQLLGLTLLLTAVYGVFMWSLIMD